LSIIANSPDGGLLERAAFGSALWAVKAWELLTDIFLLPIAG
jgi:hypothetical protein